MPKRTIHTLTWSSMNNAYELATQAQPSQHFSVEDEHSWLAWPATHTSFLFQGRAGSLRVYKEARPRDEGYWYAYCFTGQRLRKRYLGRSSALSGRSCSWLVCALRKASRTPRSTCWHPGNRRRTAHSVCTANCRSSCWRPWPTKRKERGCEPAKPCCKRSGWHGPNTIDDSF